MSPGNALLSRVVFRGRLYVYRIVAVGLAVILGAAMAELGLRLARYGDAYPDAKPPAYARVYDPFRGFFLKPNQVINWSGACFGVKGIHINQYGMRDRERQLEKTGPRVALLGDSFLRAFEVPNDAAINRALEQEFPGVEFLNFGESGYGTLQSYATYVVLARQFHPDVVMYFMYHNDLIDNHYMLRAWRDGLTEGAHPGANNYPDLVRNRDGSWRFVRPDNLVVPGGLTSLKMRLRQHSRLYFLATRVRDRFRTWRQLRVAQSSPRPTEATPVPLAAASGSLAEESRAIARVRAGMKGEASRRVLPRGHPAVGGVGRGSIVLAAHHDFPAAENLPYPQQWFELAVEGPPRNRYWSEAWEITEWSLTRLAEAVRASGATFLVIGIPAKDLLRIRQVGFQEVTGFPTPAAFEEGYCYRRVGEFLRRQQIPFLNLQEAYTQPINGTTIDPLSLYHACNIHWNERGHRLTAQLVAQFLRRELPATHPIVRAGKAGEPTVAFVN